MNRRHIQTLVPLVALFCCACGKERSAAVESAEGLDKYAALPGIRASHLDGLRNELARIESERATASQLDSGQTIPTSLGTPLAHAASLQAIFEPAVQESLTKKLNDVYPVGSFEFSTDALQSAIQLKDRYDRQRQEIHRVIANLDQGFHIQLTRGLAADTSFVDVITIGLRLDAILAAELLYREDLRGAIMVLREMISAIELLAGEHHVVPRVAAVHRRGEALRILEAIATHSQADMETHHTLRQIVEDQLVSWPPDQAAWLGDRAIGLQTFELVRDGYLLSILSDEEKSRLRREVGFKRLGKQVAENLDRDELFYLLSMRKVIAACDRPYHDRLRGFRQIERDLETLGDTLAYPLVTDLILWKDVQEGHRLQALDRARCEAWSIALAASLGLERPAYLVNPLTGTRYITDLRPAKVIVDGIDPDHAASPIVIPRLPATSTVGR